MTMMVKISTFNIFADESTETFLGGLSSLLLPETRGKQLPDDEGEEEEEERWEGGEPWKLLGWKVTEHQTVNTEVQNLTERHTIYMTRID